MVFLFPLFAIIQAVTVSVPAVWGAAGVIITACSIISGLTVKSIKDSVQISMNDMQKGFSLELDSRDEKWAKTLKEEYISLEVANLRFQLIQKDLEILKANRQHQARTNNS
jgi:hypothetical protein